MRKINVGTALNAALTGAVRSRPDAGPAAVGPRTCTAPGRDARPGPCLGSAGAE